MDIWILFTAVISSFPIVLIKYYLKSKLFFLLVAALCFYAISIFGFTQIFKTHDIGSSYLETKLLSQLLVVVAGILLFKEVLKIKQMVGIVLAIISLYLISG
jgi:multidrug transporter EmrE-like cation transporter